MYYHITLYGFFLRATRFAGSPARSGASCLSQEKQENSQPIADSYFNTEIKVRNI